MSGHCKGAAWPLFEVAWVVFLPVIICRSVSGSMITQVCEDSQAGSAAVGSKTMLFDAAAMWLAQFQSTSSPPRDHQLRNTNSWRLELLKEASLSSPPSHIWVARGNLAPTRSFSNTEGLLLPSFLLDDLHGLHTSLNSAWTPGTFAARAKQ